MKKIIFIFFSLIIIFILLFYFSIAFLTWGISPKNLENKDNFLFSIEKGEGIVLISNNLQKEALIKSKYSFIFYNLISGARKNLQAGDYFISPSMSVKEITEKFFKGDTATKKLTIIEGWRKEEIADYLKEEGICKRDEFFEIINKDFSNDFNFFESKPKELSLEGYLFPDTYEIPISSSCQDFVLRVLNNFSVKLSKEIREEILKKEKTIFEIIVVASLIEKEVRTLQDKKMVSGIIWKRLEIGMPLQIDATISYITGRRTTRISLEELKIESPYNTYLYRGLPIGPISNPGIDSITAAIFPMENEFLFYLSDKEGNTIFSRNLQEHNENKAKYLK